MSKFRDKATKIYSITFNQYTNCLNNTVSDGNKEIGKTEYVHCDSDGSLLIREDEFDFYQKYGQGIKSMNYIGIMYDCR